MTKKRRYPVTPTVRAWRARRAAERKLMRAHGHVWAGGYWTMDRAR